MRRRPSLESECWAERPTASGSDPNAFPPRKGKDRGERDGATQKRRGKCPTSALTVRRPDTRSS
eukprot:3831512-Alexandrium_andersonii.AAC.1